ncbi:glycoside hydrolase family 108 protein [Myroides odoratus]|uniref:glycoside hydrolase family 108 protein n=1 Tax=Myroides odoratus TaxID=256 RepID=UPI000765C307|nr:glycosyl hydrolase 108 family protein [Myroides odoratus]
MATYTTFENFALDAEIELLGPIIAKWEGGFVNDPIDKGGATNMGITLETWRHYGYDKNNDGKIDAEDIKLLNQSDFKYVLRRYWDKWRANEIKNQSVANILVDWYWGSGKWGIIIPQRILGVTQDGIVGPKTINALNAVNQAEFFKKVFDARVKFLNDIVKNNPTQKRFINGWMNRLNDFKFKA